MNNRALIQHQLALAHRSVGRGVGDLTDTEALRRPDGILAPAVWQVGHLALADLRFLEAAGIVPAIAVSDGYAALFQPGTGGDTPYPPLESVVATFSATHDALTRAVAEADLGRPIENSPGPFATTAEMFAFAAAHRWYHIGKITSLRGFLGKPRLFG